MLFDTLKYVKIMQDVGFNRDQSETIISVWGSVVREQFVTKQDLREALLEERLVTNEEFSKMRQEISKIRQEIGSVRIEIVGIKGGLNTLENRMTLKLGSIMVAIVVATKALEKFF